MLGSAINRWLAILLLSGCTLVQPAEALLADDNQDRLVQRRLPIPGFDAEADPRTQVEVLRALRGMVGSPLDAEPETLSESELSTLESTFQEWQKRFRDLGITNLNDIPKPWIDRALDDPRMRQAAHQLLEQYARDRKLTPPNVASSDQGPQLFPPTNKERSSEASSRGSADLSRSSSGRDNEPTGKNKTSAVPADAVPNDTVPSDAGQQDSASAELDSESRLGDDGGNNPLSSTSAAAKAALKELNAEQLDAVEALLKRLVETQEVNQAESGRTSSIDSLLPSLDASSAESDLSRSRARANRNWLDRQEFRPRSERNRQADKRPSVDEQQRSEQVRNQAGNRAAGEDDPQRRRPNTRLDNSFNPSQESSNNPAPPDSDQLPESSSQIPAGNSEASAAKDGDRNFQTVESKEAAEEKPEWRDWEPPQPSFGTAKEERESTDAMIEELITEFDRQQQSSDMPSVGGADSEAGSARSKGFDTAGKSTGKNPPKRGLEKAASRVQDWLKDFTRDMASGSSGSRSNQRNSSDATDFDVRSQVERLGLTGTLQRIVKDSLRSQGVFDEASRTAEGTGGGAARQAANAASNQFKNTPGQPGSRQSGTGRSTQEVDPTVLAESIAASASNSASGTRRGAASANQRPSGAGQSSDSNATRQVNRSDGPSLWSGVMQAIRQAPDPTAKSAASNGNDKAWSPPVRKVRFRWGYQQTLAVLTVVLLLACWFAVRKFIHQTDRPHKSQAKWVQQTLQNGIRTREDVIEAFHRLVLGFPKPAFVWWNHRSATKHVSANLPELSDAVNQLSDVYERARYLPVESSLSVEQIDRAEQALRQLKNSWLNA